MTEVTPLIGFDATDAVPELSYLFPEKFGGDGQKHEIPEPSSEQCTQFWADLRLLYLDAGLAAAPASIDGEKPEERDARLRKDLLDGLHRSTETLARRREIIAALCSGTPSLTELEALPHRILNAFESYMMAAINPNA